MSKVSIIVPVHNTEKYLEKCVGSIVNQTLTDLEIILVENGSTDNSLALCKAWEQRDPRIKVLHLPEGDLSTARNRGVQASTSPYIGFVDSDDMILPTMYEKMYHLAVDYNLGLVYCNPVYVYDDRPDRYPYSEEGGFKIVSAKEMTELNFLGKISNTACTLLYKRELFEHLKFPEKVYFEDRASTFLFMAQCERAGIIYKSYYRYYQRAGSICHNKKYVNFRDYVLSDCARLQFIQESGLFTPSEQALLAYKSANTLVRTMRKMRPYVSNREQRAEYRMLLGKTTLIPSHAKMSPSGYISLLCVKFIRSFVCVK